MKKLPIIQKEKSAIQKFVSLLHHLLSMGIYIQMC